MSDQHEFGPEHPAEPTVPAPQLPHPPVNPAVPPVPPGATLPGAALPGKGWKPNNDGSNDVLKIYGLGSAREFSFTIYNREGIRVYQTSNVPEAVGMGWDGTSRGVDLPAGVYFWEVNGHTDSGKRLLLNGKHSGSIVLLR